MRPKYTLVDFDEFIFDNFRNEIQVYVKKDASVFMVIEKVDSTYVGRKVVACGYITEFYTREELYMAIPIYLSETFTNLVPYTVLPYA